MSMNLFCAETLKGDWDIKEMIQIQNALTPNKRYFEKFQDPDTRKIVTKWMVEVCDEENCDGAVLPLAVNFFDRFVCACKEVPKKFLQLAAAVCILMASKLRQSEGIHVNTLCYYTNYSVTPSQMRAFESLISMKLRWELSAVTAFDFVDNILFKISGWFIGKRDKEAIIRKHTIILINLCYTDLEFYGSKPCVIATSCTLAACIGMKIEMDIDRLEFICSFTENDAQAVQNNVNAIERLVEEETKLLILARSVKQRDEDDAQTFGDENEPNTENVKNNNKNYA